MLGVVFGICRPASARALGPRVARSALAWCTIAAATAMISCSPFAAESSGGDAGPGDASVLPADASGGQACGDGAAPLIKFGEPLKDTNLRLDTTVENNGAVAIVQSALGGAVLRAEATPPGGPGGGARALAKWSFPVRGVRTAAVEYDFRASYGGVEVFAQGGCRLTLSGEGEANKASAMLEFGSDALLIGGRHPNAEGTGSVAFRGTVPLSKPSFGAADAAMRHATFVFTLGTATATVSASIDRGSTVAQTFITAFTTDAIEVACGVVYADNSDEKKIVIEVANLSVVACP